MNHALATADAEPALLASLTDDPEQFADVVGSVEKDDFLIPHHGELYALMLRMWRAEEAIDAVTVPMAVAPDEDRYGGLEYVAELFKTQRSSKHAGAYARQIAKKSAQRKAIKVMHWAVDKVAEDQAEAAIERAIESLQVLQALASGKKTSVTTKRAMLRNLIEVLDAGGIEGAFRLPSEAISSRIPTFLPGDVTLIGGTPGAGKTVLLSQISRWMESEGPTGECHLEMGDLDLSLREMAARADVDMGTLMDAARGAGDISSHAWGRMLQAAEDASENAYVEPTTMVSMAQVQACATRLDRQARNETGEGLRAFFLDYAQLVQKGEGDDEGTAALNLAVGYGCKAIARRLGCHVFVLTQLTRKAEEAGQKGEALGAMHIYGGGGLDMAATNTICLFRDRQMSPTVVTLHVSKSRHGSPGQVDMKFDGRHQRIHDLDVPQISKAAPSEAEVAAKMGFPDEIPNEHPTWKGTRE